MGTQRQLSRPTPEGPLLAAIRLSPIEPRYKNNKPRRSGVCLSGQPQAAQPMCSPPLTEKSAPVE